jgi:hypothetical protein
MFVLATTSAFTFSFWLVALWLVIIPAFAIIPIMYALAQTAGERAENLAYARGDVPEDADIVVTKP